MVVISGFVHRYDMYVNIITRKNVALYFVFYLLLRNDLIEFR